MNKHALRKNILATATMGLLLLQLGCGILDPFTSQVLKPSELCSDHSDDAIPTFEDATLAEATLHAVNRSEKTTFFGSREVHDDLTCDLVSRLTELDASSSGIGSLVGIQNITGLFTLDLSSNSINDISSLSGLTPHSLRQEDAPPHPGLGSLNLGNNLVTDISALSGLTGLGSLFLNNNLITDIDPLSGVTGLVAVSLDNNSITDIGALSRLTDLTAVYLGGNRDLSNIQPLLDNTGVGAGDLVDLIATNVSCTDVAALEAKGVSVTSDCP